MSIKKASSKESIDGLNSKVIQQVKDFIDQNSTVGDLLDYIDQHRSYLFKLNEELSEASRSYLIYK
ncbi:hypothetical protein OHW01_15665 [Acinetobacter baumannii]|uniref:hypothetical protein n=1 Tax=Acinetobacter baumannii TaxID=470 RepID=UPI00228A1DA0|nr:hypothetical protein [Acinetobacter baumannii]MDC4672543.1 hypothetical protein [Acinetobacter baumannii]MDC4876312.1 hypothetical protein [Acinetobacter baumannii]MDC4882403.1 hypothetical protein [Acinetobacter baumannii]MDC4889418.1 hypothetical protein [Acinetobacter baumannii]MDC4905212.1 hypothetical protein [Acinetobacter baumannii]